MRGVPPHVVVVLVVAVTAISSSAVLVRHMVAEPVAIALWRCVGAAVLLSPALLRFEWTRPQLLRGLVAGAFLAAHFTVWFASLSYTSVMRSVLLVSTGPVWVGLIERVQGKPVPTPFWIGVGAALPGVALMSMEGSVERPDALYGDFLAVVGAWLVAGYLLIGRQVRETVPNGAWFGLVSASAALTLLPAALFFDTPLWGFDTTTWLLLVAATAGPQLLGHNGFNYALEFVPARVVSTMFLLEPVGATLLAGVFLAEWPDVWGIAGGFVVLAGTALAIRAQPVPEDH